MPGIASVGSGKRPAERAATAGGMGGGGKAAVAVGAARPAGADVACAGEFTEVGSALAFVAVGATVSCCIRLSKCESDVPAAWNASGKSAAIRRSSAAASGSAHARAALTTARALA